MPYRPDAKARLRGEQRAGCDPAPLCRARRALLTRQITVTTRVNPYQEEERLRHLCRPRLYGAEAVDAGWILGKHLYAAQTDRQF